MSVNPGDCFGKALRVCLAKANCVVAYYRDLKDAVIKNCGEILT